MQGEEDSVFGGDGLETWVEMGLLVSLVLLVCSVLVMPVMLFGSGYHAEQRASAGRSSWESCLISMQRLLVFLLCMRGETLHLRVRFVHI